jgi:uncharacterized SAM-binding protein YcdF (DUF218 family)/glycopeptide antibiotics resistance protein/uncharacterized RDD family membrane protein YckC
VSGYESSAIVAVMVGVLLIPVLFIPYVSWSYRRHGILAPGRAVLAGATLVYLMTLWTYTILPLPDPATLDCSNGGVRPRLAPFASFSEIDLAANGWRDPMLTQMVMNVALFVPFGMLLRHLIKPRRAAWIVAAGFGVSLLIETSQLTGIWGIYPCSYRLFEVDDLITNTLGVTIGVLLAPALRLVPGQKELPRDEARVVKRGRRLLGMLVDFMAVTLLAVVVYLPFGAWARDSGRFGTDVLYDRIHSWVELIVSMAVLLLVPWRVRGATLGQVVTYVRPVAADGQPPSAGQRLLRWATGLGGYFVATSLGTITGWSPLKAAASLFAVISLAAVVIWHPRGISGWAARLSLVDSRDSGVESSRARHVDQRSLGIAVLAVTVVGFIVASTFREIAEVFPTLGLVLGGLALLTLGLGALAVVPYLVVMGIITIRRERVSLATLLPLVAAAGIVALTAVFVVALLTGTDWLLIISAAAVAVVGYLGSLFVAFLLFGQWYARHSPEGVPDAIVVLGSRVFGDRVPPLLAARIDRGIGLLENILQEDPEAPTVLVCSGGQGPDEERPEAPVMADYARAAGVAADRVLEEDRSRSTEQNLRFTQEILAREGLGEVMVAVTNDFHAFRAAIIAREAGIDAEVIGAHTAHYYFLSAIMREFVGVLSRSPRLHAAITLVLALGAGALTFLITR